MTAVGEEPSTREAPEACLDQGPPGACGAGSALTAPAAQSAATAQQATARGPQATAALASVLAAPGPLAPEPGYHQPGPCGEALPGPVALFGTSADPPTLGHRQMLLGLRQLYPLVATWASDNPLKQHTAPLTLRQRLLEAVVRAIGDPHVQLVQELSSPWAVETLERARQLWPDRALVFVIGSDLAPQLPQWREARRLLALGRLAIAPRAGWSLGPADLEPLRQLGASVEVLPLRIPATASSTLRAPSGAADAAQLPEELWPLLLQHNPYGLVPP